MELRWRCCILFGVEFFRALQLQKARPRFRCAKVSARPAEIVPANSTLSSSTFPVSCRADLTSNTAIRALSPHCAVHPMTQLILLQRFI